KRLEDLKGKVISLGGPKDITRIYVERMLAPHGVAPGEFDMVFAGATAARASALLAGAVDAAILLPPFNFQAVSAGFFRPRSTSQRVGPVSPSLGHPVVYASDLPFSGTVVNVAWARDHAAIVQKILAAHTRSVAWFEDDANRADAIRILVKASGLKPDDVE